MAVYVKKTFDQMIHDSQERALTQDFYIEYEDRGYFLVRNLEKNTLYKIEFLDELIISCDCPHAIYRMQGNKCKHCYYISNLTGKYIV